MYSPVPRRTVSTPARTRTLGDVLTVFGALAMLASGALALRTAMDRFDPRAAALRSVRSTGDPRHDVLFVPPENAELVAAAWPLPVVRGVPHLGTLPAGFRRLFALGSTEGHFVPLEARLGPAHAVLGEGARRWDLEGLRTVALDLGDGLLQRVRARREGGAVDGPCAPAGNELRCSSPDPWNHLRVEPHFVDGASVPCVLTHPQNRSTLVLEIDEAPAARYLVGMVAVDDQALFPEGQPVQTVVRIESAGAPPQEHTVVAPNARGGAFFRFDLGNRPSHVRFSIRTNNAASRTHCLLARWTR